MIRSLPLAVLTPPKRETRQEPGLDIHREQLNLRPAVAITVALAVRVATWLFVRLLYLFRFFRWPVVILLAESRHECAEGQNQSHQNHHCYSLDFSHNHLPPPRIQRFHARGEAGSPRCPCFQQYGCQHLVWTLHPGRKFSTN